VGGFLLFVGLFVFILIVIRDNRDNDEPWYMLFFQSSYPNEDAYSNDPLLEAYISLGALMVRKDTSSYGEKIQYLNHYFSKNFPQTHYDFGRSFTDSLKNPIRPHVISKWLRRRLPYRTQRIQVMYFLAGLSTVDGSMNTREIELLKEMNELLELSPKDFDSIIAMYTQKQERRSDAEHSKPDPSAVHIACKILGVSEHASLDEIKKAYRSLVKLHHPDRFATESIAQQELARQRFIEIQKAYELLEWKKGGR
jgi:DnaJ like chaperone protein